MNVADAALEEPTQDTRKRPVADELLRWLLRYPLLSVEDLAAALGYSPAQCYRHLVELLRRRWVEAVTVSALGISRARLYHLSHEGVRALAALDDRDPGALARRFHAEEPHLLRLLMRAPALVAVQTLIRGIVTQAPVALASAHRPCRVTWSWARDYRLMAVVPGSGGDEERAPSLLLDAYLILRTLPSQGAAPEQDRRQAGELVARESSAGELSPRLGCKLRAGRTENATWHGVFVLYDGGLLPERLMAKRLHTLLVCREAPERWTHSTAYGAFPTLLVITPDARRAICWHLAAQAVAAKAGVDPLCGGVLVATAHSLAMPWRAGWHDFDGNTTRRLADLLISSDAEALPPISVRPQRRNPGAGARRVPLLEPSVHVGIMDSELADGARVAGEPPTRYPIIGSYNARARQVTAGGRADTSQGHAQHSARPRDQLALAVLRLRTRHIDTLRLLHDHPLLNRAEVAAALAIEDTSAARYLSCLRREGLVVAITARPDTLGWSASIAVRFTQPYRALDEWELERASGSGDRGEQRDPSTQARYLLSDDGLRLLAAGARLRPRSLSHVEDAPRRRFTSHEAAKAMRDERLVRAYQGCVTGSNLRSLLARPRLPTLLRYPAHTAGVYTFFATLLRATEHQRLHGEAQELLWWETGASCIRRYRYHERWCNFRPDGAGEYRAGGIGGRRITFWLEWDRGTMGLRDLQAKFLSYAEYVMSREWMRDAFGALPRLLIVTSDGTQQPRVTEALESALSAIPTLAVVMTTSAQIVSSGPLNDIWRPWLRSSQSGHKLGHACQALS